MTDQITIYGSPVSPYVRKVLAILDMKNVPFRCVPVVPFTAGEDFVKISPMRRIPVLQQGDFTLPDSTAIAHYLEETCPEPAIYPGDAQGRARVRWFEEYADDHLGRNILFNLFFQRVVRPRVLKEEPDQALIDEALDVNLPAALDYLEREVPEGGFIAGDASVADIMIGALFRNANWAGWQIDAARWPNMAAYLTRVADIPSLAKMNALGEALMGTNPREHQTIVDSQLAAA
ncbi:MAG: glutathione S-transferase family protein [Alphaproteobacteria bacterium]|nr:glutathione S-transferase family protein [Alphaproteobacteria bacterium]